MVSTTGFTSSFIASVRESGMFCTKSLLEFGKTASLSAFTHLLNNSTAAFFSGITGMCLKLYSVEMMF